MWTNFDQIPLNLEEFNPFKIELVVLRRATGVA